MNDLNQWEKALRSWTPRPPSAKLKHRLFPATDFAEPRRADWMPLWNRLGPATCILLLTLLFCAGRSEVTKNLAAEGNSNTLASLFLSSHNSVASYTGIAERSEVGTPGVTFDWTKGGSSLSTTGSFLFGRTNM